VSFNYLGHFEAESGSTAEASMFAVTNEPTGPEMDFGDRRPHLLEISGVVSGGQLRLRFNYSAAAHRSSTIERLAHAMGEALRHLVEGCRSAGQAVYTISDFPLADLDAETFGELSALLDDE
jgi:non-ribosomal peptide synthase protein (TIGR01720 family)